VSNALEKSKMAMSTCCPLSCSCRKSLIVVISWVSQEYPDLKPDCLLYRTIKKEEDHLTPQADLKHLEEWANKWGMRFNTKKCYVLSINNKSSRYYQLEKHTLQEVQDNIVSNRRQINGQTSWHSLEGHLYGIRTLSDRVQYLEALQSLLMFPLNFHPPLKTPGEN
jgi:hypothetical protein